MGSLGLSILFTDAYFYFYPQQVYYQVFVTMLGLCITIGSAQLLVETPMQWLLEGDQMQATRSLEYIKKRNGLRD